MALAAGGRRSCCHNKEGHATSTVRIRTAEERDAAAHAAIRSATGPEPVTTEMVAEWFREDAQNPYLIYAYLSAVDEHDAVLAAGYVKHSEEMNPGQFWGHVRVAPEARGRGVGTAVTQYMEEWARARGGTEFESYARGEDDESYAWAQRRGYTCDRQRTESVREMADWDGSPFADAVARVRESGCRLITTGRVTDESLLRGIYDVMQATWKDVPAANTEFAGYEQWLHEWQSVTADYVTALALDGERVAGVTTLEFSRAADAAAHTGYTGVHPRYRGHGIALAIKVLVINIAKERGVPRLRTNNDPDNPAMLRVNAKLGYQQVPGPRRLIKQLL